MSFNLSCISLNVRGLNSPSKRKTLFTFFKENFQGHFVYLQETHSTAQDESKWINEWNSDIIFNHGESNSKGVAILFPHNVEYKILKHTCVNAGRFLQVFVQLDKTEFILSNVYAPTKDNPSEQNEFLNNILNHLEEESSQNLILGGDFNITLNPNLDKKGGCIEGKSKYRDNLISSIKDLNLVDIWREQNPNGMLFTFSRKNPIILSRLDFFLIPAFLAPLCKTSIKPSIKTDHSVITLNIKGKGFEDRGPGFWKFNSSLLEDEEFVLKTKQNILQLKEKYFFMNDKQLKWDTIKCELRGFIVKFSKLKARKLRKDEENIAKELDDQKRKMSEDPTEENVNKYNEIKEKLELINENKTRGIILRSKAKWCEEGEKCTKYFLSLEKRNYKNKYISTITSNKGVLEGREKILKEEQSFFEKLYTSDLDYCDYKNYIDQFTYNMNIQKLEKEDSLSCEGPITVHECEAILNTFKCNKSPGTDGFQMEFYKYFWKEISELIIDSLNESIQKHKLSIDQRKSIITLVPKKDKDRTVLKNWRPISLLNFDYKILSKVLARRIKKFLPQIVDTDQTGYIENRFIGENIRTISDLIHYTSLKNIPGLILLVDFEKAFDTVEWNFLDKVLDTFGFGESFRLWVKILYTDISSCVINNGFSTPFFKISRGVRQGCPLSPYLFILCVELLAIRIRENKNVHGIRIGETEFKISQLADDTTCFLSDEKSGIELLNIIQNFKHCSGLKINLDKTEAVWIGSCKNFRPGILPVKWSKGQFFTLGIWFSSKGEEEMLRKNFNTKLEELKLTLNLWKMRNLTLIGKILITKTLAIPKLIYQAQVLPFSSELIKEVEKEINAFIWNNEKPKVKSTVSSQKISKGGLKVPKFDIQVKSLRLGWVKRIFTNIKSKLRSIIQFYLQDIELNDFIISRGCMNHLDIDTFLPKFYSDIFSTWREFRHIVNVEPVVFKESLWFNDNIKIDNKEVFWKKWYERGILYIGDIVDRDKDFLSHEKLSETHNLNISFFEYYCLRNAIPYSWRKHIRQNDNSFINRNTLILSFNGNRSPISNMTCKDFYWILMESIAELPTCIPKWENIFDSKLTQQELESIYKLPFTISMETSLQSFQYKLIHRFLAHNKLLYAMKIKTSPSCILCGNLDTIEHRFYFCEYVGTYWKHFQTWWNRLNITYINDISYQDIIFGFYEEKCESLNYCILLSKYYIQFVFNSDTGHSGPSLYIFLQFLRRKLFVKKSIYCGRRNLDYYNQVWKKIEDKIISM